MTTICSGMARLRALAPLAVGVGLWLGVAAPASAEGWPDRPVRLVVGFAAGGGSDIGGRLYAAALSERLGQPVQVENRTGAGGLLATELVAHAAPDGYTLLACTIGHVLAPLLYKKLSFDPKKDFAPISATATLANILVVHNALPIHTLGDLIARAKAEPGKLSYGSSGIGGSLHLTMEIFKSMAGVDIVHVPYRGGAAALTDVIGGHVDMMFGNATEQVAAVRGGQVRALAVSSATRLKMLPDVPTVAEAGVPGFDVVSWYGVCAPAGVPEPILAKLSAETIAALQSPDYQRRVLEQGIEPAPMTRAQYAAFLDAQSIKWTKAVKDAGIKPE
jgi:tripartite-type tricarboxylate transporter receptor subunit TctC